MPGWERLELLVITNDMKVHSRYLSSCPFTIRECFRFLVKANLWKKKKILHFLHIHTVVLQYLYIWYMTSWVINITTKMSVTNKNENNIQMLAGILSPFKDLTPHSLVYFGGLHQTGNKWKSSFNTSKLRGCAPTCVLANDCAVKNAVVLEHEDLYLQRTIFV